jgi:hypothetical protein
MGPTETANQKRIETEKAIVKHAIAGLLKLGYLITVNDGEETTLLRSANVDTIFAAMFTTDEDFLFVYDCSRSVFGTVRFIYGNGAEAPPFPTPRGFSFPNPSRPFPLPPPPPDPIFFSPYPNVISDYGDTIRAVLEPTFAFAETLQG